MQNAKRPQKMRISDVILQEFDGETSRTRNVLSAVPADKMEWSPGHGLHTIGWNLNHLADIISWTPIILNQHEFDMCPVGEEPFKNPEVTDPAVILAKYDVDVRAAKEVIAATTDATFDELWTMLAGGEVLFSMSKGLCLRTWVLNHSVHHRAILSVYLRMAGIQLTPPYDG